MSFAKRLGTSWSISSYEFSSSSNDSGWLSPTPAYGCLVAAVSSKKFITSSNSSSEHCDAFDLRLLKDLRNASSSSFMQYGVPVQSSTVDEKRMYVAGCWKRRE